MLAIEKNIGLRRRLNSLSPDHGGLLLHSDVRPGVQVQQKFKEEKPARVDGRQLIYNFLLGGAGAEGGGDFSPPPPPPA